MKKSFEALFRRISQDSRILTPLFRHYLHLFIDCEGKIISIMDRWGYAYHTMVDELSNAGNIRNFFDLSPENKKAMKKLQPVLSRERVPAGESSYVVLRNSNNFKLTEDPEAFYTAFPNFIMYVMKLEDNIFYCTIRQSSTMPNFFPQRPACILYIDAKERLAGFNQTFYSFFAPTVKKPESLLSKPVSHFLDPTPGQIRDRRIGQTVLPDPALMVTQYENSPAVTRSLRGLKPLYKNSVALSPEGLVFTNTTREHIYITLPVEVDTARDFSFELAFKTINGETPLLALGEKTGREFGPDENGYLVGPDFHQDRYIIKRTGLVQIINPSVVHSSHSIQYNLDKVGDALLFSVNNKRKLAFYDLNFLHKKKGFLSFVLRVESACLVQKVKYSETGEIVQRPPLEVPMTRLKTPAGQWFIIRPLDCSPLTNVVGHITAYLLENVTEMQKHLERLEIENRRIQAVSGYSETQFVGSSPSVRSVREVAERAARSEATILIQGETGTGKEVLANFIHQCSARENGPFIKVDCSLIPTTLMESELFGHEKGAFTGATEQHIGHLERADNGTLFLDEIGNLEPDIQAKLLHFMQDHTIQRVGGKYTISLNVRILVASNINLSDLVAQGKFRSDLYYRIEVVTINMPPLRERKEDITDLCRHFIGLFNARHQRETKDLRTRLKGRSSSAMKNIFRRSF
jgi:hypothetical protein